MESPITSVISTNNNLNYVKLAYKSIRKNAYYKDQPIIILAENCTDQTNEWLRVIGKTDKNLFYYIQFNELPLGIGGGMDFCVSKVKTEYVNILHSDMWIAPNQDIELQKIVEENKGTRTIASSFRIQPKIFPNDPDYRPGTVFVPKEEFGEFHHNFDNEWFDEWATQLSSMDENRVRKGGGAGFFCRTEDYKWIGGNDPIFSPASFDDMDLFIRMQLEDYKFIMSSKSIVYHFSARGSHFRDDDITKTGERQQVAESNNARKFYNKWGQMPESDEHTFVKPIKGTKNPNRISLL
jgi:GT2 family glycosyltransferase